MYQLKHAGFCMCEKKGQRISEKEVTLPVKCMIMTESSADLADDAERRLLVALTERIVLENF